MDFLVVVGNKLLELISDPFQLFVLLFFVVQSLVIYISTRRTRLKLEASIARCERNEAKNLIFMYRALTASKQYRLLLEQTGGGNRKPLKGLNELDGTFETLRREIHNDETLRDKGFQETLARINAESEKKL